MVLFILHGNNTYVCPHGFNNVLWENQEQKNAYHLYSDGSSNNGLVSEMTMVKLLCIILLQIDPRERGYSWQEEDGDVVDPVSGEETVSGWNDFSRFSILIKQIDPCQ